MFSRDLRVARVRTFLAAVASPQKWRRPDGGAEGRVRRAALVARGRAARGGWRRLLGPSDSERPDGLCSGGGIPRAPAWVSKGVPVEVGCGPHDPGLLTPNPASDCYWESSSLSAPPPVPLAPSPASPSPRKSGQGKIPLAGSFGVVSGDPGPHPARPCPGVAEPALPV